MNLYHLLPLFAFLANVPLGIYIIYRNPHSKLNILYGICAFSWAVWALADFSVFSAASAEAAFIMDKVGYIGASFTAVFVLHFFSEFAGKEFLAKKLNLLAMYTPLILFVIIILTTNLVAETMVKSWFGYVAVHDSLYLPLAFYVLLYTLTGLLFCYCFYLRCKPGNEKKQARLLIIAVAVPVVGGTFTQIVPVFFNIVMIPLTSTLTMFSAVVIAYAMSRYRLMVPPSLSIQRKLIAGFLVVGLLVMLVGYVSINRSREALQKSIGYESVSMAIEAMDKIDRTIYYRIEEMQILSNDLSLQEAVTKSNRESEGLDNVQEYISERDSEWLSAPIGTITPFMQELINNELSMVLKDRIGFYEDKYGYNVFGEIFATNKHGANVGQTEKTTDYYQADEEWWQSAKEHGSYVENVEYDRSAGIYSVDIEMRIDDEDGNFGGVLKAVLNLREIIDIIREISDPFEHRQLPMHEEHRTMDFKLITGDGKYIYSTEEFEIFEDVSGKEFFKGITGNRGYFIAKGDKPGETEELLAYARSDGYRDFKGLGWILLVEHEVGEIMSPVTELENIILFISTAVTLFAILTGILISRSISKPIIRLRDITSRIGKGDLGAKIDIRSGDEIGELASAFGQMTRNLKKSQEQVRRHAEELEQKVDERTADLDRKVKELTSTKTAMLNMMEDMDEANRELVETQEELKKSLHDLKGIDVKKNQFISIAAHELKTPLTSIHGFSQLLQNRQVANNFTKRNKYLKIMGQETKRLAKLVNDMLDLSRIDLGTVKLALSETDIGGLLEGVKREMEMPIKEKGLKFEFEIAKGIPKIATDMEKLTQILINVINNAMKYTPKGKISVKAFIDNKTVHFIIKDTGIGIAKENQEKIFDRFYQVDSSYTRKAGGTGLGLALCKEFVELLGGKMWIKSELGKGSEFHFTLPVEGVPAK